MARRFRRASRRAVKLGIDWQSPVDPPPKRKRPGPDEGAEARELSFGGDGPDDSPNPSIPQADGGDA